MKILHALVGYLTATALPFFPFALAHPLAASSIDYNGSVNPSKNHIDGALMKRVPGDIIEARQVEILDIALVFVIVTAVLIDIKWITEDKPVRGNEVEFLVDHFD